MKYRTYFPYEPMNFFFFRDKKGKLSATTNGSGFPDRKTLLEMFGVLNDILLIDEKELERISLGIIEQRKRADMEWNEGMRNRNHKREPEEGYIYLIKSLNLYKIGRCKSLDRIGVYRTENPHKIKLIFQVKVSDYRETERILLKRYFKKQYRGEWFRLDKQDILDIQKTLL